MEALLVDDSRAMRMLLTNMVRPFGFAEIRQAGNGQEALDLMDKHAKAVQLVLLDWNMPVMQGIELLRAVRADAELKSLPFLMVTAEAQKENIIEAVQAGVSNYVVKPFTAEALQEKLEKIFAKTQPVKA